MLKFLKELKLIKPIIILISICMIDSAIVLFADKIGFTRWLWKCVVELAFVSFAGSGEQAFIIITNAAAGLAAGTAILWGLIYAIPHLVMGVLGEFNSDTKY